MSADSTSALARTDTGLVSACTENCAFFTNTPLGVNRVLDLSPPNLGNASAGCPGLSTPESAERIFTGWADGQQLYAGMILADIGDIKPADCADAPVKTETFVRVEGEPDELNNTHGDFRSVMFQDGQSVGPFAEHTPTLRDISRPAACELASGVADFYAVIVEHFRGAS